MLNDGLCLMVVALTVSRWSCYSDKMQMIYTMSCKVIRPVYLNLIKLLLVRPCLVVSLANSSTVTAHCIILLFGLIFC